MNPLPPLIALETAHVWVAVMGGERACLQLLAAKLHEAVTAAGLAPAPPIPAAPAPIGGDGGAAPPVQPPAASLAASSEPEKIMARSFAPEPEPAGPTVTIKGAEIPLSRVLDLWYEADSIAAIGDALGCSGQTVVNVSKRLDLPSRFSPAWVAERDLRRRASGRVVASNEGPVAQLDRAPAGCGGDGAAAPEVVGSSPTGSPPSHAVSATPPWPEKPRPRVRCQFVLSADRNGATTCRGDRVAGEVYCADHLAQVRAERGRP